MLFLEKHLHILLYAGFWISLGTYGLVAPDHRVAELGSALVTKGAHLSLIALVLGAPPVLLYCWRMRGSPAGSPPESGAGRG